MGHWLPLQQFVQIRTARGVAKITMSAVQQCRSRRPTLQHRTGQISTGILEKHLSALVWGHWSQDASHWRGVNTEALPMATQLKFLGRLNTPELSLDGCLLQRMWMYQWYPVIQVTRCGTDQLLMWMQKSKLAHSIPCLIISWLKRLKLFFALLLCWRGGIPLHFFSCLFLLSFVVLFCWGEV